MECSMNRTKKWIWEDERYPRFPYDKSQMLDRIGRIEHLKGKIDGILSFAGSEELDALEINNLTDEIMGTSEIEGEYLRRESVRDSIAQLINTHYRSAQNQSTRQTDALAALLLDCTRNNTPLTIERLHGWHNALFAHSAYGDGTAKIALGAFRDYDDMKVVENAFGRGGAVVKYVAPPHDRIDTFIDDLLDYCARSDENPYIQSALAHLWFVSIHPYDDGNGRIARAIADYLLSHGTQEHYKAYSISMTFLSNRVMYYDMLDETTNLHKNRQYDFTPWVAWHLDMLIKALETSLDRVSFIVDKTRFWDRCRHQRLNEKQIMVLEKVLADRSMGKETIISPKMYREIAQTTQITASRDIKKLTEAGCVRKVEGKGGRSTGYVLL